MYPTGAAAPKFYGLPKIHKRGIPLRPIVSSRGTTTYEAAKELARILRTLVGRSPHHIKNTTDFVDQIHGIQLQEGECVSSFDVSALFTSVPTEPAINILKRKLEKDQELHLRILMTVKHNWSSVWRPHISSFKAGTLKRYEQPCAHPSAPYWPTSTWRNLRSGPSTQLSIIQEWEGYVDDTLVITETSHKGEFLEHLNSLDAHIQYT